MKICYLLLFTFLLVLFGCVSPEDFEVPKAECTAPNITANISVEDFQKQALGSSYKLSDDFIVEAYVVSSDEQGNFFKTLSLVSADGVYGFNINLDRESLHTFFDLGRQVFLKAKGLNIARSDDEVEVGVPFSSGVGRIPNLAIDSFLIRGCKTINPNTLIQKATLSKLSNDQLNTLIELDSIQFVPNSAGASYFVPTRSAGSGTNHYIEDEQGNQLLVRMSQYADFASETIPTGVGKIRGVLQKFGSSFQLIIRDTSDIDIYAPARLWGFSSTPIEGTQLSIAALRDSFAQGITTLSSKSYIDAVVTASPNDGGNTGSSLNVYIQGDTAGILLRTKNPSKLLEGYKIKVDVQNAILSEFRGLLQLTNIEAQFKIEVVSTDEPMPTPREVTIQELLSGRYESQLVSIKNVQFTEVPSLLSGSNYITDGKNIALVYTQTSAPFSGGVVPRGMGTFLGIASIFNGVQLVIRNTDFFADFNQARVDVTQQAALKDLNYVRGLASELASGAFVNIQENIKIKGVVISQQSTENIQSNNVIVQDETAGVVVRFTSTPELALGDEIEVGVLGAKLENYNGLLQVNDVPTSNIINKQAGVLPDAKKISITDLLAGEHQSELVFIDSVQFVQSGAYVQNDANTSLTVENCSGQVTVFIRKDATFGSESISQMNGKITGVITAFNTPQLYIRDITDVVFEDERQVCILPSSDLMITEVGDPKNNYKLRFVEIYNPGASPVSADGWVLKRYVNGKTTSSNISLNDTMIESKGFYIIAAYADFNGDGGFSIAPTQVNSIVNINGDDVVELWNPDGEIVDVFGEKGVDGTGTPWDYVDGRATRKSTIASPNGTFQIGEWDIIKNNQNAPDNFNPGIR